MPETLNDDEQNGPAANARDQKIATMEADDMNDDARDSSASRGSGLFRVTGDLHWSCQTEKGHQRIAAGVDMELPFPPFVGLCIQIDDEIPSPKIKKVVWCHRDQSFSIHAGMRLKDWDSKLFESLLKDIRCAGAGYFPTLYDDNWMYGQ